MLQNEDMSLVSECDVEDRDESDTESNTGPRQIDEITRE